VHATTKSSENRGPSEPWQVQEELWVIGKDAPVRPRVGNDQDESIRRILASLQTKAALQSLSIPDSHFDLDGRTHRVAFDDSVPSPEFQPAWRGREWHLRAIPEWMTEVFDERLDAAELSCVAQRITTGIEPNDCVESEDCRDLSDLHNRCPRPLGRFDATERRAGQMRSCCDLILA